MRLLRSQSRFLALTPSSPTSTAIRTARSWNFHSPRTRWDVLVQSLETERSASTSGRGRSQWAEQVTIRTESSDPSRDCPRKHLSSPPLRNSFKLARPPLHSHLPIADEPAESATITRKKRPPVLVPSGSLQIMRRWLFGVSRCRALRRRSRHIKRCEESGKNGCIWPDPESPDSGCTRNTISRWAK